MIRIAKIIRTEERPVVFIRVFLFLFVCLAALLQNTQGLTMVFPNVRLMPLIPLSVCIGMLDGELSGLLYGLLGGAFWDVCAGGPDGVHGIFLAVTGCAAGLLCRFYLRPTLLTQYVITLAAALLYASGDWLFSVLIPVGDAGFRQLLLFYLPAALVTVLLSFIIYALVLLITRYHDGIGEKS